MPSLGLSRKQIIILAVLALLDCVVIAGMGLVVIPSLSSTPPPTPQTIAETDTGVQVTVTSIATPPPPPPTWTPRPTATPPGWKPLYTFDPHKCPFEVPEGADVQCGAVILPEDRESSELGQVHLEVSVYAGEETAEAPPFIYLSGGPGGAAVEDLSQAYEWFIKPLLAHRDVIAFDQRGIGLSEPNLECFEYVQAAASDLEKGFSTVERAEAYPEAMRRCHNRLVARGVHPAAYTSAANAADVRDLVEVLGYEQAILYGASYGSRLALTVMRDHPEVVHSAILDGVEPIEAPMYNGYAAGIDRLLHRLFDGCAADMACRRAYPDLEAEYEALVEQLDADPVEVWTKRVGGKMYRVRVDGDRLTGTIFYSAYSTEMITYLPRMIRDTAQGDYE
ncbi:MAG: alpha/beta fold hydrolase, partial [Anaerolineae bacterium]